MKSITQKIGLFLLILFFTSSCVGAIKKSLLDPKSFLGFYLSLDPFKQKTMPFLSEDKQDFIQYANICQIRSNNNKNLWDRKAETLKKGEELIAILKNKYRLK